MRIWLDPQKLFAYGLMPSDIEAAVSAQNVQVSAGKIGAQPAPPDQQLNATVTAQSKLRTAAEFEQIIVKHDPSGARVRLSRRRACRARAARPTTSRPGSTATRPRASR